jgi:hypothetical protein
MISVDHSIPLRRSSLADGQRRLDLAGLQSPNSVTLHASTQTAPKPELPASPEKNPAHFAPENPTNRELAKERWYTRAGWASVGLGYVSATSLILYGEPSYSSRAVVTGLFIDSMFSYFALKNSELRRFILEGKVLPLPSHSSGAAVSLLSWGGAFQLLGATSNAIFVGSLCAEGNFRGALFRGAMALISLHLGVAWLRRVSFFRSFGSQ